MSETEIRVHVASINTCSVTELCVRSMRKYAGIPFELVVGDGGSTDRSLEMLRGFEKRGWLDLVIDVTEPPRMHGQWLDRWLAECPRRYCVFSDSDVEFLGSGWLSDMLDVTVATGAAMVCAHFTPSDLHYLHPAYGVEMHLAARPSPWLMLVDVEQVRDGPECASFMFHEDAATSTSPAVYYDVGGYFFRELVERRLPWQAMPEAWLEKVHHFGGMSWGLPGGGGNRAFLADAPDLSWIRQQRVRARELRKRAEVRVHLEALRRSPTR